MSELVTSRLRLEPLSRPAFNLFVEKILTDPKVVADEIKRLLEPKAVVAFLSKHMKEQDKRLRRRQEMAAEQLRKAGLLSVGGMGHVMTGPEAFKRGISYLSPYKAAREHNLKHERGNWVNLKQYTAREITLVKDKRNWSQYEIEHLTPALFKGELQAAKAGLPAVHTTKALSPPEAAKRALQKTTAGAMINYGADAAETAARVAGKIADTVKDVATGIGKSLAWFGQNWKWFAIGGIGFAGLIAFSKIRALIPSRRTA